MVRLIKDGIIMEVSNEMAKVFLDAKYTEVVEVETTSNIKDELENHDETENIDTIEKIEVEAESKDEDEVETKTKYTKTEINRMSTADLKELAPTLGIEVTEESTGADLKKGIIEALGL